VPLLGEGVLSTWELPVEEIVSSGSDRIIVYEGAEEKLKQLGSGLLEKLGIGGPSWEQEERARYRGSMVPVENQLAAGLPAAQPEQRRIQPASASAFEPEDDYDYVEVEERRQREPLRQRRYLDEDEAPREQAYRRDLAEPRRELSDPRRGIGEPLEEEPIRPRPEPRPQPQPRRRPPAPVNREPLDVEVDDLGDPW
jgi:hypothetical protein